MSPRSWPSNICMICEGELSRGEKGLCEECVANPTGDRRGINRAPRDPRLTPDRTSDLEFDTTYRLNPHILKWWTTEHDAALIELMKERGWAWPWEATARIVEITPPETLEAWRASDPICAEYAWYNVLMYFAGSRAQLPEFPDMRADPKPRACLSCGHAFIEASLRANQFVYRGASYCGICLDQVFQQQGDVDASRDQIIEYVQELCRLSGRIPPQAFGTWKDLQGLDVGRQAKLMSLLRARPAPEAVRREFGSWFVALVEAGVIEGGSQQMSRGIRSVALDGHVCLSLGERTICDVLHLAGIEHEREPRYPGSKMRADFLVGDCFIEFLGLAGDTDYDAKTRRKIALAVDHGLELMLLTHDDLRDLAVLEARLTALAASDTA